MPNVDKDENMIAIFNTETSRTGVKVERGEALVVTSEQVPFLEKSWAEWCGRVHERALCLPEFCANATLQLSCVVRRSGSGSVEVVDANGACYWSVGRKIIRVYRFGQTSLDISPEIEERIRANMSKNQAFMPSSN
ncbi:hypothetical protein Sjap_023897 [Stephania japonica]|uniref:Uncharacterized protein n=1 Tax=Stephania japonica TaxID=461633 RepID=A0AAP0HPN4_9MAGN